MSPLPVINTRSVFLLWICSSEQTQMAEVPAPATAHPEDASPGMPRLQEVSARCFTKLSSVSHDDGGYWIMLTLAALTLVSVVFVFSFS